MDKHNFKTKIVLLSCIFSLLGFSVSAAGLVPCGGPGQEQCTLCHLLVLVKLATDWILAAVLIMAAFAITIGGFMIMINSSSPEKRSLAKKIIFSSVAGLMIIFSGWALTNTYFASAGTAEWNGYSLTKSWWRVNATCYSYENKTLGGCGDGEWDTANEQCDPSVSIEDCQNALGWDQEKCELVWSKCDPDTCKADFCGNGVVEASDEECDYGETPASCAQRTGKSEAECEKEIKLCSRDCKLTEVEEEQEEEEEEINPNTQLAINCLNAEDPRDFAMDCTPLHDGLDNYVLIVEDAYVDPNTYVGGQLKKTYYQGKDICMCYDTCMYNVLFKYVVKDKERGLFDIYGPARQWQGVSLSSTSDVVNNVRFEQIMSQDTKPVIYLYPEEETQVKVTVTPKGEMTASIPDYDGGWMVDASPSGLIDNEFDYLFYETELPFSEIEMPDTGFSLAYADLEKFFDEILPLLGLQGKEIVQFKEWWLPKLEGPQYYLVKLLEREVIDEIEPLTIEPSPDSVIRIRFVFLPLNEPVFLEPPALASFERKGFTAVEWGGIMKK